MITLRDHAKLNALPLPNGARAVNMRLLPLTAELNRLGIPGLAPEMGKIDMLAAYHAALLERAREMQSPFDRDRKVYPGEKFMRRAAEELAAKARQKKAA